MQNCAFSLNLSNLSPTTYWDYDFNSLAILDGKLLGGSPDGLYQLDSGETDAGTEILAKFRSLLTDFGDDHIKRLRYVILGVESEGDLTLRIIGDEAILFEYTIATDLISSYQHGLRKAINSTPIARYWGVEIENVDGIDFSVDRISVALILLNKRWAVRSRFGKVEIYFPGFELCPFDFSEFIIESTGTVA